MSNHTSNRCRIVTSFAELTELRARYGCIYADPPWQFDNRVSRAAAENHYRTIPFDELSVLPIASLAADSCHLHLWVPNALLGRGLQLIECWGFRYVSCFVWIKPQIGLGNYWRNSHELLLLGVKGKAPFMRHNIKSWCLARRTRHSTKPDVIRLLVESVSAGPFLELFGRREVSGWTVFGNDVERRLF